MRERVGKSFDGLVLIALQRLPVTLRNPVRSDDLLQRPSISSRAGGYRVREK